MKKSFKQVFALLLALTMVLGCLTACGGKDPTGETGGSNTNETTEAANKADGSTFTYAIGGDPGANVNVITSSVK